MIREVDINEISDGRFYTPDQLVKLGCHDCRGCSECCRAMADTIILDPLDVHNLSVSLGMTFSQMLGSILKLDMADGIALPFFNTGDSAACPLLTDEGRCSVHALRPGFCRLFPMGRFYEDGSFRYFLQVDECVVKNRYKVRLRDWLDIDDLPRYERFICDWHYFLKSIPDLLENCSQEEAGSVLSYIVKFFYNTPYDGTDFYSEFSRRLEKISAVLFPE